MRAMVYNRYGSPEDVLQLTDIDKPVPGDDQVLIKVHAAGVDPSVWHLVTGLPFLVRIMGFGLLKPKYSIAGWDVAGQVEAVGKNVQQFRPGDEVFGTCRGSFAEYACAAEDKFVTKPSNLTLEQAAAIPVSGLTALQGLRDVAKVQPGQKVLVIGAGGGVGSYAVQIAKAFGAEVTGVCSTAKVDLVRSLGADFVIDYTKEDLSKKGQRYDCILDTGGRRPLSHLRRVLAPEGTLVGVGGEGGGKWTGGFLGDQIRTLAISPFTRQRLRSMMAKTRKDDLVVLKNMIEAGKVTPALDRTFPLAEAAQAIRYLTEGKVKGKCVITI
ncbi:MAG: NAD(P)-dependent alcohol dehydrogenase [candidate division Zixibacteria bacterium]|nr:NAD(P)-dependent alcohol dehydrogenase [candidate division Zixibacteria bacterium]